MKKLVRLIVKNLLVNGSSPGSNQNSVADEEAARVRNAAKQTAAAMFPLSQDNEINSELIEQMFESLEAITPTPRSAQQLARLRNVCANVTNAKALYKDIRLAVKPLFDDVRSSRVR